MYAESIRITLKPGCELNATDLALLVRNMLRVPFSMSNCLYVGRCLKRGESWEPEPHMLIDEPRGAEALAAFDFVVEMPADPYAEAKARRRAEAELLDRACDGDAEAAIQLCRAIRSGEIIFGTPCG